MFKLVKISGTSTLSFFFFFLHFRNCLNGQICPTLFHTFITLVFMSLSMCRDFAGLLHQDKPVCHTETISLIHTNMPENLS